MNPIRHPLPAPCAATLTHSTPHAGFPLIGPTGWPPRAAGPWRAGPATRSGLPARQGTPTRGFCLAGPDGRTQCSPHCQATLKLSTQAVRYLVVELDPETGQVRPEIRDDDRESDLCREEREARSRGGGSAPSPGLRPSSREPADGIAGAFGKDSAPSPGLRPPSPRWAREKRG